MVILTLLGAPLAVALAAKPEVKYIGRETLQEMLGDPRVLVLKHGWNGWLKTGYPNEPK